MASINLTTQFTDMQPELGPPKPLFCVDGPTNHVWTLSIEEGQLTLTCDCNLCPNGITDEFEPEEFEMPPIYVELTINVENPGSDSAYPWVELTPTGQRPPRIEQS